LNDGNLVGGKNKKGNEKRELERGKTVSFGEKRAFKAKFLNIGFFYGFDVFQDFFKINNKFPKGNMKKV